MGSYWRLGIGTGKWEKENNSMEIRAHWAKLKLYNT